MYIFPVQMATLETTIDRLTCNEERFRNEIEPFEGFSCGLWYVFYYITFYTIIIPKEVKDKYVRSYAIYVANVNCAFYKEQLLHVKDLLNRFVKDAQVDTYNEKAAWVVAILIAKKFDESLQLRHFELRKLLDDVGFMFTNPADIIDLEKCFLRVLEWKVVPPYFSFSMFYPVPLPPLYVLYPVPHPAGEATPPNATRKRQTPDAEHQTQVLEKSCKRVLHFI